MHSLHYIGIITRPGATTYLEGVIPGTRMVWRGTHLAPQEKPKNMQENPTFGTPPLEKKSFSILD